MKRVLKREVATTLIRWSAKLNFYPTYAKLCLKGLKWWWYYYTGENCVGDWYRKIPDDYD